MKQKFTLNIDDTLIQKMRIEAVLAKRSVSNITEELYRQFLDHHKQLKAKEKVKR